VPMSFRVTPEFKAKLDRAAKESGRSLAQEIELRLERSLDEERYLTDGLELGFGRQVAGLMLAIGIAANHAAPMRRLPGQLGWLSDPEAFSVVAESIDLLLKTIAPDGDREAWAKLRAALHSKDGVDAEGRDSTEGPVWAAVLAAEAVINHPGLDEIQPLSPMASKWLGEAVVARIKDRLAISSSEEE
jgi:hypothetical protein